MKNLAEQKAATGSIEGDPIEVMIRGRVYLSPMSGITDPPFRLLARRYGCPFAFTEMIDVNGLYYGNIKTLRMLEWTREDRPLGVQIVGQDEKKVMYAAELCEDKGLSLIDLNAGCPARKVVKAGKGAALLKDPVKFGRLVRKITKRVRVPVTVKIRSGWDGDNLNYMDVARAVESSGAGALCIHPRTQNQMYRGRPDHDIAREIKDTVNIPVFASGNVFSAGDVREILDLTGCDAVAVARGVFGRPWIFREIQDYFHTGRETGIYPSFDEIKRVIWEHTMLHLDFLEKERVFSRMYKHVCWYLKKYKNLNEVMKEYAGIKSVEDLRIFLDRLELENGRYLRLGKR